MSTGVQEFAAQSVLNEIRNSSPDVSTTFLFNSNCEITATDDQTNSLTASQAAKTFSKLADKAERIGGLESVTFFGSNRRMNISCVHDSFLAIASSRESDAKYTETLARVLTQTVLRLTENLNIGTDRGPIPQQKSIDLSINPETIDEPSIEDLGKTEQVESQSSIEEPASELAYEPSSEPSATQFIIENLGGLLVAPDTVRIDNAVILQWKELYEDKQIAEVDVETLNGETTRCKFKPIKDSKREGKGMIQMPQKIQLSLKTSAGELVMVKPVIN